MEKENKKIFTILGEEFQIKHFPVLYKWHKTNPETLEERLGDLAKKLYQGEVGMAGAMLESDLQHYQ